MCYISDLHSAIQKRTQVDAIYVDFAKAFDKVPHELVIRKLHLYGFPEWLTKWLYSYLHDRKAFVRIGTNRSCCFSTPSGVPQGSHLGPLIFVIFINDLCDILKSSKLLYADDLKIYREIFSTLDCVALQADIDILMWWSDIHGMQVNISKCNCLSFTKSRTSVIFNYKMDNVDLKRVTTTRDLGVIVDSKLSFAEHIASTSSKGFALLGFLRRNASQFDDAYTLKTLYCSLIRSILEHAVQVWAPYHAVQIEQLEKVQRRFLRFSLRHLPWNDPMRLPPYSERCNLISIELLSRRRIFLQRLFIYDLLVNNIDCPSLLQRINIHAPSRRLRSSDALWLPMSRTLFGQNHPFYRCCRRFNEVYNLFDFNVSKEKFKLIIRNE